MSIHSRGTKTYINIELTNMHDLPLQAVDDSLKSVNLFYGGVGDKQVGKYSGGMKRRLSVAISLIGDPKVLHLNMLTVSNV